jgi:glycosyltransferase involved in cell wall biosynthesis
MDFMPRPAGMLDLFHGMRRTAKRKVRQLLDPEHGASGFGMILDMGVPIIYSSSVVAAPLGIAHALPRCRRAVILVYFTMTMESPRQVRKMRQAAVWHRLLNPGHTLVFLCNTAAEERLLRRAGELAIHLNHNAFISYHAFRPLPPRPILYDAVYNARLAPFKRHDLSLEIERCAFIYYHAEQETNASDAAVRKRHAELAPGHVFVNRLQDGAPVWLSHTEVNEVYNQSAVGLCLSAKEGAMFASMEYMLAGLPIVSTPSVGGRDVYFDDDYCIIADPDPRAIRDAVAAMKARAIPRDFIAARTREKVTRDRDRLVSLLDELRARDGRALSPRAELFGPGARIEWRRWQEFLDRLPPHAFD